MASWIDFKPREIFFPPNSEINALKIARVGEYLLIDKVVSIRLDCLDLKYWTHIIKKNCGIGFS